jgi:arginine transport system permease protein
MDLMGYAQRINAQTYDTLVVFSVAGSFYLIITAVLTLIFRLLEKKALDSKTVVKLLFFLLPPIIGGVIEFTK